MPDASANVTISNRLGLHARPAMSMVDVASGFTSDVRIINGKQSVDAKSIMQIMMLAATKGTQLTLEADGPDAQDAVQALADLVNRHFDEEN